MDVKDQVKEHISIVDVASLYVSLKPSGKNLKALCPFHAEKTPSFYVSPERGTFTCYGCNRFGDIFTMVQEMENLSFPEAVNFLIDKFHVPVQKSRERRVKRDDYLSVNRMAMEFFRERLASGAEGRRAVQYLRERGISAATADSFSLGWAPSGWDGLNRFLQEQGVPEAKSIELGLLVKSERNKVYDRFRARLMFPIFSESGAVIAFGGRTLGDEKPKYLNSPDTPIYRKGEHLFGFQVAKEPIRKQREAVLVEGYMDMISLHQYGVSTAVASLGTAVTEKQIYLLKRFADEICMFYDNDKAGEAATVRAIEKMFAENVNPRVLVCKGYKDPDEFVRQEGIKGFQAVRGAASDGMRFLLDAAGRQFDLARPEKKKQAVDWVMAAVSRFGDPLVRDEYLQITARYFAVDPALLRAVTAPPPRVPAADGPLRLTPAEETFLAALVQAPGLIDEARSYIDDEILSLLNGRTIIRALFTQRGSDGLPSWTQIDRQLNDSERAALGRVRRNAPPSGADGDKARERLADCIRAFHGQLNKKRLGMIAQEITVAEREGNRDRVEYLLRLKNEFIQSRRKAKREEQVEP